MKHAKGTALALCLFNGKTHVFMKRAKILTYVYFNDQNTGKYKVR
jgi:hypothetical protein